MSPHVEKTISAVNELLDKHRESDKTSTTQTVVTIETFCGSGRNQVVVSRKPIEQMEKLTTKNYFANGSTDLNDAIGSSLQAVNSILSEKKKKYRETVIITILTDGEENTSRAYDTATIKAMVKAAEEKDWSFIFLGVGLDAFAQSSAYGFNAHNTLAYDTANMSEAINAVGRSTLSMKMAYSSGLSATEARAAGAFTENERKESL
jgi:uncharacterized protein YegL